MNHASSPKGASSPIFSILGFDFQGVRRLFLANEDRWWKVQKDDEKEEGTHTVRPFYSSYTFCGLEMCAKKLRELCVLCERKTYPHTPTMFFFSQNNTEEQNTQHSKHVVAPPPSPPPKGGA